MPESLNARRNWKTTDPSYSEDKFYTSSTDGQGHSSHIRVNVPPNVAGRVEALVQKGMIPAYKTRQDVMRDALIHRLNYIEDNFDVGEDLSRALQVQRAQSEVQAAKEEMNTNRNYVDSLKDSLHQAHREGNLTILHNLVSNATDQIDNLMEPYRSEVQTIVNQFKTYLKEG